MDASHYNLFFLEPIEMNPLIRDHVFSHKTYNVVGRALGYFIAPLSLAGFFLPVYLRLPHQIQKIIGSIFLVLAALTVFFNVYLICHKKTKGQGASMFPAVFSASCIPALFLLVPERVYWLLLPTVMIIGFDFFGQAFVAGKITTYFFADRPSKV